MIPARMRRVRVLATVALGVVMLWLWSRNIGLGRIEPIQMPEKIIGGGSVLRPVVQEAPLQPPPIQEPDPPSPQDLPPKHIPTSKPLPKTSTPPNDKAAAIPAPKATSIPTVPKISPNLHVDEHNRDRVQLGQGRKEASIHRSQTTISTIHWVQQSERYPISTTIQLPAGTSKPFPRIQRAVNKLSTNGPDSEKLAAIKAAAVRTWNGYREFAWGQDEVLPVTGAFKNPFMGWGATLVDGLDTLYVMGLHEEFKEAVEAVGNIDFTTSPRNDIPLFETVIRYLGGLIAAYDVSGKQHRILLDKAVELAEILYGAFDTPNRVPVTFPKWKPAYASQPHRAHTKIVLAEIGTLSMEFTRLAQLTGEPKYYDAIARITDMLEEWQGHTRIPGMWPTYLDGSGCNRTYEVKTPQELPDNVALGAPVSAGSIPDTLTGLNQPSTLDVKEASKADALPIQLDYQGTIYKRQLVTPDTTDALTTDFGTMISSDDKVDTLDELDQRAPADMEKKLIPLVHEDDNCKPQGLASTSKNIGETFTLGGASDSAYEYLTKEYLLLGGQVEKYKTMYLDSMKAAIDKLLYKPMTEDERDILMTGSMSVKPNYSQPLDEREYIEVMSYEMAHLTCFAGGMFAMGGVLFDEPDHVKIGARITDGCVWAYNVTGTGIMPENAWVMPCDYVQGECKWNETAWWDELDPYADTRTKVYTPSKTTTAPTKMPQLQFTDDDAPPSNPKQDNAAPSHAALTKRQLEGLAEDDEDSDTDETELDPPTPGLTPDTSSTSYPRPIYTPPPPLSHEDYVAKKITDEGLPPGFIRINSRNYVLRPEAIESVFYMYRITGDTHWRDVGWDMWTAIDTHARAPYGYSAISDVTDGNETTLSDQEESFWLAETLKYFYLLYDDPDVWSLDEWVLNTEAHLFRRPEVEFV